MRLSINQAGLPPTFCLCLSQAGITRRWSLLERSLYHRLLLSRWPSFLQLCSNMSISVVTHYQLQEDVIPLLAPMHHFKPSVHATGHLPPDILTFKAIQIPQNLTVCALCPWSMKQKAQPSDLCILNVAYRFWKPVLSQYCLLAERQESYISPFTNTSSSSPSLFLSDYPRPSLPKTLFPLTSLLLTYFLVLP